MKGFTIYIPIIAYREIGIEAENKEEAIKLAYKYVIGDCPDDDNIKVVVENSLDLDNDNGIELDDNPENWEIIEEEL